MSKADKIEEAMLDIAVVGGGLWAFTALIAHCKRKADEAEHKGAEGVGYAKAQKPFWYGIPNIQFIFHGDWADPDIYYRGKYYNASVVEDDYWTVYQDEGSNIPFEDWMRQHEKEIKYSLQYEYQPQRPYNVLRRTRSLL